MKKINWKKLGIVAGCLVAVYVIYCIVDEICFASYGHISRNIEDCEDFIDEEIEEDFDLKC